MSDSTQEGEGEYGLFEAPLIWVMFCWMAGVPAIVQTMFGGEFFAWYMWRGRAVIPSGGASFRPLSKPSYGQPVARQYELGDYLE